MLYNNVGLNSKATEETVSESTKNYLVDWNGQTAAGCVTTGLDYADDIALIENSRTGMQQLTREIEKTSGSVGLRMNAEK